jgi:hypothetical protein
VIPVSTTIRSTTGTAPLTFDRISPELVQITDEQGATQIYYVADLEKVCRTEHEQEH